MSIFDYVIDNFPPAKNRQEFRREVKGSGTVPIDIGAIPGNDYHLESFTQHDELAGFVPLDWVKIDNKSNNDILVKLDQDDNRAVPFTAGQTNTIDGLGKFRTLEIVNLGSTKIAENDLKVTVMRTPKDRGDDYQKRKEIIQGF